MLTQTFSRLFAIVMTIVLTLVALQPQTAYACFCAPDPNLTDEERLTQNLNWSDMAFVGRADTVTLLDEQNSPNGYYHVEIAVDETYKGDVPQTLTIATHESGSVCGYYFEEGMTYLIFAHYTENDDYGGIEWRTDSCSGNEREPTADVISTVANVSTQVNIPTAVTTQNESTAGSTNWLWAIPLAIGAATTIVLSRKKPTV